MSIEHQATFWQRNVNDYNGECGGVPELAEGFRAFSDLFKQLFSDYRSYELSTAESVQTKIGIMADDLENYHNLTETADCLYQMAVTGVLRRENGESCLDIKKATFKSAFKGSVVLPFHMLENYGFYFRYFKGEKEATAYKNCDSFLLFCDGRAGVTPAMKAFADALAETNAKDDYAAKKHLFFFADFESALLKNSTKQTDISPLKPGILRTAGEKVDIWREIAERLGGRMGVKACINPYVFPNWTVKFLQEKKTIITFTISPGTIFVELPLSYETAKTVIQTRDTLPPLFVKSIDGFGCIGCGKCSGQSNLEVFEGVSLCRLGSTNFLTEDSRSIVGEVASTEDVAAIVNLLVNS